MILYSLMDLASRSPLNLSVNRKRGLSAMYFSIVDDPPASQDLYEHQLQAQRGQVLSSRPPESMTGQLQERPSRKVPDCCMESTMTFLDTMPPRMSPKALMSAIVSWYFFMA